MDEDQSLASRQIPEALAKPVPERTASYEKHHSKSSSGHRGHHQTSGHDRRGHHATQPPSRRVHHQHIERHSNGAVLRRWSDGVETTIDDGSFTIMTYNLLADSLATANSYLYGYCQRHHLDFRSRGPVLLREILARRFSVYCFQELDMKHYHELFEPVMNSAGYASFFKKRTGHEKFDGCAIFYRRDQVHAVTIKGVEYRHNTYAERENVGIVALLDVKDGPRRRRVCIATTHVLFNPKRGLIKLAQLRYLLNVARATVAVEDEEVPTILCGDLNSFPESLVFDYLTTPGVQLTCVPESSMSGQQGVWNKSQPQYCNVDLVREFEKAFAEASKDEAKIGESFLAMQRDKSIPSGNAPMDLGQTVDIQLSMTSATTATSTTPFDPRMPARAFQQQIRSTTSVSVSLTFGYLPQHFDFESSYWDRRWKSGNVPVRNQTRIIDQDRTTGDALAVSREQDIHCRNGWTTHHGRCQAVCDYIFYGHLRPEARIKTRQELLKIGHGQGSSIHATPEVHDSHEHDGQEPRFRTKLVPAAILELPCELISSSPRYKGLPNEDFGSDHLSLVTKFRFEDEQTVSNKEFTSAQLDSALKKHHHQWTYSVPELPDTFELPMVPRLHRPHARDHHAYHHHHPRMAQNPQHGHESRQDRGQSSERGRDRGRGRGGPGHRRGFTRGRGNHSTSNPNSQKNS